ALLREQHADLASLTLVDAGEGWDNRLFRLGERLAVRMPRRAASVVLMEQEQRWLPELSARLPLPIPVPIRIGRPGCGYPWRWSVVPWLPGESALFVRWHRRLMAVDLGRFLRRLHQPAPEDAPLNPWRGIPLRYRDHAFRKHLQQLEGLVEQSNALSVWDRALSASPWPGPPLWIHGDLHPGNLLVTRGRLSAVIDFGDLAAGDPATDLGVMWMMLPSQVRPAFLSSVRGPFNPCDEHTQMRARGWAVALGVSWLSRSVNDDAMRALAARGGTPGISEAATCVSEGLSARFAPPKARRR
ncbi:MAG TPA: aminoglycoside phosphotransferase family protein, partial [Gammaproteobacteria bacterium]|nr:aminoglycoside phosphotransferase family protein [Gammaproteobacteria bacterium]